MAVLIKKPKREKFALESLDLLDILVQKHEHEEDIEEQLAHVDEMKEVAYGIIRQCERRRDVASKTPDTPTAEIRKRLSDMDINKKVDKIIQSEHWGDWEMLRANGPPRRIEGFLRDPYLHRPLNLDTNRASAKAGVNEAEIPKVDIDRGITPKSTVPS